MSSTSKKPLNVLKTLILPVVVYIVLLISTGGRFGQPASLVLVFRQSVIPILIAMAIGFNMTMGMWDFSAGAVVVVSAIIGATIAKDTGTGIPVMVIVCIAVTIGLTALTGLLYNLMKVPSIVLTVGMSMCYEAIPRMLSFNRIQINVKDAVLAQSPWCFIVLGIMFVVFYIVFNYTTFGHNVKAIGANQTIANNAGVNLPKTKFIGFLLGGVFLGVAGFMYISNNNALMAPGSFSSISLIFDAMMGIFIAFFLERYCNFSVGIVIGAISMTMLSSGLVALGMDTTIRNITSGLFLLVLLIISSNQAVVDDMRSRKRLARKAEEQYRLMQKAK